MFSALAEFERALIRERTRAGLAAAKRAGRTGGRPRKLTENDLNIARTLLANPDITVGDVADRLGVRVKAAIPWRVQNRLHRTYGELVQRSARAAWASTGRAVQLGERQPSSAAKTSRIDGTSRNWLRDRCFSRRFPSGRFEENPGTRCLGIAVSAASSTGCNSRSYPSVCWSQ